ncbi:hypothetical protein FIBSPDRAFT_481374 [Athelia psychrophila]|uniref:Uncharacterized protein n=1 Tax=Athelia psychrophila TaxID=1759441 RepID=A0A166VG73_9AGAM|nr:hypothetical protein FIBSPDRAFT_481374 [Fibularhizoctonia sp. CBS 109695]
MRTSTTYADEEKKKNMDIRGGRSRAWSGNDHLFCCAYETSSLISPSCKEPDYGCSLGAKRAMGALLQSPSRPPGTQRVSFRGREKFRWVLPSREGQRYTAVIGGSFIALEGGNDFAARIVLVGDSWVDHDDGSAIGAGSTGWELFHPAYPHQDAAAGEDSAL